jgi:hypothetical protein
MKNNLIIYLPKNKAGNPNKKSRLAHISECNFGGGK